jgi:hypothetical protein
MHVAQRDQRGPTTASILLAPPLQGRAEGVIDPVIVNLARSATNPRGNLPEPVDSTDSDRSLAPPLVVAEQVVDSPADVTSRPLNR